MSQKIIIPKGAIDSAHDNIIEIPNYLHDVTTVMVTTARKADPVVEEALDGNDYYLTENAGEQNEASWEQNYDVADTIDDTEYSPEQPEEYQYDPATEEQENNAKIEQQADDQGNSYANYAPEQPVQPTRRPRYEQQNEQLIKRRITEKKRDVGKLKAERQRMVEGEIGTYETYPVTGDLVEENSANLSEVPENLRARLVARENNIEKDKKRRQLDFERPQPYNPSLQVNQHPGQSQRKQSTPRYLSDMQRQRFYIARPLNQPWDPNNQEYYDVNYVRAGRPRQQPPQVGYPAGQMAGHGQADPRREDYRRYQRTGRRPTFQAPVN